MTPTTCPNCGQPPGECYHLCCFSEHYYSPEQERADEPFYGDDDIRERYAGEIIDADYEQACADQADAEIAREDDRWTYIYPPPTLPDSTNDIPF